MQIFITGGAGCLGASLVDRLLSDDHDILVLDNFSTGYRSSLPDNPRLQIVEGDIADAALVEECFAVRPDWVVHCAASYKDPDDWSTDVSVNVLGMINVVRSSQRVGISRFLNFQTALCYGRPERLPIPPDHPVAPFTSYGISKTSAEQYLALSGLPYVSMRLANVTGPRLSIGPIPTFYERLKDGKSCFCTDTIRDFIDMEDFLSIAMRALESENINGIYNVSTGEGHSIKEVFDVVVEHLGVSLTEPVDVVPPTEDDVPAVVLDPRSTEADFEWKARIGFKDTVKRMLCWYDEFGVSTVYSHLKTPSRN